jgi:iron complex outermembrane receptor protein
MGGTVKLVTNQPKLNTFEGSVQGNFSNTQGGGNNGGGNLMLNVPLGDMFAFRLVAGDQYRGGWIDNITVHPFPVTLGDPRQGDVLAAPVQSEYKDANNDKLTVVRGALLFQPNEDVSVTLTGFTQHMALGGYDLLDGSPINAFPSRVYNAHYEAFPIREAIHDDIHIYGLTGVFNLGFADLTSATAYWDRLGWQTQDASQSIYWTNNGGTPFVSIPYSEKDPSHQFSQELRLTSHDTGALHWVAGVFYSSLRSIWEELSSNPAIALEYPNIPDGSLFTSFNPYTVKQTALFADGSYKLTDTLKLEAGARWYTYKSQQDEFSWGYDGPSPTPPAAPTVTRASDNGFNPRINLSYEPTKDLNLYATASRGFRPGGANQILPPPNEPPHCTPGTLTFGPDSVWNYEVGEKAKLFDNRVTINGDVYYEKWNGVQQVFTLVCGYQFYDNAGDGRAFGPELEINAKLSTHWTLQLTGSWTDSKITSPNALYQQYLSAQVTLPDGVTHPCPPVGNCEVHILNVPKETASATLAYTTEVLPGYQLTARVSDSFVGWSYDVAYYYDYQLPSYSIANARLILAHDNWQTTLFVDNLANKVALETANNTSFQFNIPQLVRYSTNQPRTVGMQVNYRF